MDMMPPIWPCWRRAIHTNSPISSSTGSSSGSHVSRKPADGVENLMPLEANRLASESGRGVGPVVVTLSPLFKVAVMWPLVLS